MEKVEKPFLFTDGDATPPVTPHVSSSEIMSHAEIAAKTDPTTKTLEHDKKQNPSPVDTPLHGKKESPSPFHSRSNSPTPSPPPATSVTSTDTNANPPPSSSPTIIQARDTNHIVTILPQVLVSVDATTGVPLVVPDMLRFFEKQGWSEEFVQEQCGGEPDAVACWLRGQDLTSPRVQLAGAHLLEWVQAQFQQRPIRQVRIDTTKNNILIASGLHCVKRPSVNGAVAAASNATTTTTTTTTVTPPPLHPSTPPPNTLRKNNYVEFLPETFLTLDATGIPVAAVAIDRYLTSQKMTHKRLFQIAGVISSNGHKWFQGRNLSYSSVQKAGAVILETVSAMQQQRTPRLVHYDPVKVKAFLANAPATTTTTTRKRPRQSEEEEDDETTSTSSSYSSGNSSKATKEDAVQVIEPPPHPQDVPVVQFEHGATLDVLGRYVRNQWNWAALRVRKRHALELESDLTKSARQLQQVQTIQHRTRDICVLLEGDDGNDAKAWRDALQEITQETTTLNDAHAKKSAAMATYRAHDEQLDKEMESAKPEGEMRICENLMKLLDWYASFTGWKDVEVENG